MGSFSHFISFNTIRTEIEVAHLLAAEIYKKTLTSNYISKESSYTRVRAVLQLLLVCVINFRKKSPLIFSSIKSKISVDKFIRNKNHLIFFSFTKKKAAFHFSALIFTLQHKYTPVHKKSVLCTRLTLNE